MLDSGDSRGECAGSDLFDETVRAVRQLSEIQRPQVVEPELLLGGSFPEWTTLHG